MSLATARRDLVRPPPRRASRTEYYEVVGVKATSPDSRGSFEALIDANPVGGDYDGERVNSWANLPTRVPLLAMNSR